MLPWALRDAKKFVLLNGFKRSNRWWLWVYGNAEEMVGTVMDGIGILGVD